MNVSVIVPVFNERTHIERLCTALKAQSYSDFEVIIVDNGSVDGTAEAAARYFPVISCPEKGEHPSRNLGISRANGELLLFLDGDTVPDRRWVEQMVESYKAGYELIGGNTIVVPFRKGRFFEETVRHYAIATLNVRVNGASAYFPTCNVGYSSRVLREVGPFPNIYYGDVVYSEYVSQLGTYKATINRSAIVHHYAADSYLAMMRKHFRNGAARRLSGLRLSLAAINIIISPLEYIATLLSLTTQMESANQTFFNDVFVPFTVRFIEDKVTTIGAMWYTLNPPDRIPC